MEKQKLTDKQIHYINHMVDGVMFLISRETKISVEDCSTIAHAFRHVLELSLLHDDLRD